MQNFISYLDDKVEEIESEVYSPEYASLRKRRRAEFRCEDCGHLLKRQWDDDINVLTYCPVCNM